MKSRTTSVYYIQFSNDEQITDNQHTVRSTHDKLRTLRPDGQGSSREAEARDHGTELHDHESEGHDHASENHTATTTRKRKHDHAGEIAFTKEQAARTDFELLTVEPAPFRDVDRDKQAGFWQRKATRPP